MATTTVPPLSLAPDRTGGAVASTARALLGRGGKLAGTLLMVAVLVLSLAYLVPSLLGYERYIITGGSMTGTYDKGSVVYDRVVPSDQLRVGDVITYVPPPDSGVNMLVTHRIVAKHRTAHGTVFRTKGDANPAKDPWTFTLDRAQQPVVQFHVPYIGWFFLLLADPHRRALLIGVPAGLVALISLGEAARNARAGRRERALPVTVAHTGS
jgi:signal peptidase I